jgi:hypothetical protein
MGYMPCPFQEGRKDNIQDPEAPHAFTFCGRAAYLAYILTSSALRCVSVGVSMRASRLRDNRFSHHHTKMSSAPPARPVVHLSAWHPDPLSYLYHLLIGSHERSSKLPHSSMRVALKASHNNTGHHGLGSFHTRTFGLPRASPASNMPFRTRAHPSLPHVHAPCPHT